MSNDTRSRLESLSQEETLRLWDKLNEMAADQLLDPEVPEEDVDETLRELGMDPEEVEKCSREFFSNLFSDKS